MAISEKTRKILWARSGNRCALCRCELTTSGLDGSAATVLGEECHIVGRQPAGPRGMSEANPGADHYDNLILLCRNCHKLVDSNPAVYTVEMLTLQKGAHESWVRANVERNRGKSRTGGDDDPNSDGVTLLPRVQSGIDLCNILRGAYAYRFGHDEANDREESDLLAYFFQEIEDWGDLLSDMSMGKVVETEFRLGQLLAEMRDRGFLVFGIGRTERHTIGKSRDPWRVAYVQVVREGNPGVVGGPSGSD